MMMTTIRWSEVARVGLELLISLLLLSSDFYMGIACMSCIPMLTLRRHFKRESCFCPPNYRYPTGRSEPYVTNLLKLYVRRPYSCHELFGFDIMLDENLKPWVLEVNISPR